MSIVISTNSSAFFDNVVVSLENNANNGLEANIGSGVFIQGGTLRSAGNGNDGLSISGNARVSTTETPVMNLLDNTNFGLGVVSGGSFFSSGAVTSIGNDIDILVGPGSSTFFGGPEPNFETCRLVGVTGGLTCPTPS